VDELKMSREPLASIVVITYNNATTIEECLRSLIDQTYSNKEIIVVYDEASNDGTKEVLKPLVNSYKDVLRLISVPHKGRSYSRNIGWKNSRGEIILFADADDLYCKHCLEKAVSQLESDPKIGCVCLTGSSLTSGRGFLAGCMEVYSKLQQANLERGVFKPFWAEVYRKEALEKVGGFDEALDQAEDKDLFVRVIGAGYNFGLVTGLNWFYRRPTSLWTYLKKRYLGGVRRIPFIAKHGEWRELWLKLPSLGFLILLLVLSTSYPFLLLLMIVCFMVLMMLSVIKLKRLVWNKVKKRRYIFLYPVFILISYLFTVMGYVHGLLLFSLKIGLAKVQN
jgi:cellulose synthase/poly-beta-1,6-N-acetylglucosamine synthase-like glycosyltransferase